MKILIIEDEQELTQVMRTSLEKGNYLVEHAADYHTALDKIVSYDYDCILLDIMLPGGSGLELLSELKKLRKEEAVIIISAKDAVDDKVLGLELGADDYLAKPFHLAELNARVKSAIRRKNQNGEQYIGWRNITIDPENRAVRVNHTELVLNRKEFDLLYYFITNPERLITKTSIAEYVWGDHTDQADSLDFVYSQIKNLRKKLNKAKAEVDIQAVYGVGYKIV
ncbi:DNA-binding response regulator, OmpR family, contains REC and winged-helix (wHTH) domain [Sinomicrobium oceani]|uniref:DNA-binding response regulator, OmpR family, contains REC and winged-helix (WHTH) domain n=1 Tax=Sinomicrobium oceani TaxID=1150368 RepID=A0A1K1RGU4_9FLAO|nr:response regulator transcription factor [Sinomicrobium oceani]SFW71280.1 DNA-binding response regulator, OmpR family, contains REC and winged-helix (wHTH) domain [Sinomicrobium oceani]